MFAYRLNRDVVLLVTFILLAQLAAWAAPVEVIPLTGGSWRYNQSNNLDGVMWMAPSYDDTQPLWQEGPALLSNDTGNAAINPLIGRVINGPRVAAQGVVQHSYYFRTRFNWGSAPEPGTILTFLTRIDDGAIIFLNGTEILRVFVASTSQVVFASSDFATGFLCGGDADCDGNWSVTLTTGAPLVQGTNVLAAIVYQEGADSSDITFGMRVSVVPPLAPTITDITQPSNRVVIANRPTRMFMSVTGSPPSTFQWFHEPEAGGGFTPLVDGPGISGATNSSLTISNVAASDAGRYFCTANNPAGAATSRTNVVQVTPDISGPVVVRVSGSATFDRFIVEFDEVVEPGTATDAFNYTISGFPPPANPISVTPSADGRTVTLMTDPQTGQTPDTDYTIDISNVTDLLTQPMVSTQVVVHTWIHTPCGGALFEAFNAGVGTAVSVLTGHPSFPNNPDFSARLNAMDIRVATDPANPTFYSGDGRDNYGGRLRALFIASESGPHVFYFASDDNGELWLSTDAESTNKVLIARETVWSNTKQWTNSGGLSILTTGGKRSAPIDLEAGKGYYIEALYKEGAGGDNCAVAVQPPSQANPPLEMADAIPGTQLGFTAIPPGIAGAVNISQHPASTVLDAPNRATFSVAASASGAPFLCYQWQKAEADGGGVFIEIPGATSPSFTTPFTSVAADNGDRYRVVVNAIGGSATSAVATLTVNADVIRPTVVKVVPTNAMSVSVVFSEPMDVATATDPFNYSLGGGSGVASADIDPGNPTRVNLAINPPMTIGNLYTLTMNGPSSGGLLEDTSGNDINPDPTSVTFRAQTFSGNVDTIPKLPTTGKLPLGSLTTRGIMVRFVKVSTAIANDIAVAEQMLGGIYPTNAVSPLPNIAPLPLHFEPGMINYNKDGPTSMDGNLVPDAQFPGFGSVSNAVLDNLAMEAVCYVELQQGIYRMVVRSDDNFRLTTGLSAEDPGNSFVIGEFNVPGGRGVADSPTNDFIVAEAGLYPMRLVFEQGQSGTAVEWKIQDTETGTYYGVNASLALAAGFPGGGPSAYLPPCSNKALNVKKSGANLVITWPLAGGGNLFQLQQANALSNPSSTTVWSNVGVVPVTVTGTKTVTVPLSAAANFYRLVRPGSPCAP